MNKDNKFQVSVGDVLGTNFELPNGIKNLEGWIVYNVFENGLVQVLEPAESAIQEEVTWDEAKKHLQKLAEQGHRQLYLVGADNLSIYFNIVKAGHNHIAQLDGDYWAGGDPGFGDHLVGVTSPMNKGMGYTVATYRDHGATAKVRATRDVDEIKVMQMMHDLGHDFS